MKLAFSGHIDLFEKDKKIIYDQLKLKLQEIKQSNNLEEVLAGVAEGADKLCIACCKELNIPIRDLNDYVYKQKEDSDTQYYERQCEYMVKHCEHFIVVWDGLFTEKPGGTSWLVNLLLQQSSKNVLHHLITPRKSNPYPVNFLRSKNLDTYGEQIESKLPWLPKFCWSSFEIGMNVKVKTYDKNSTNRYEDSLAVKFIIPVILALITLILGTIGYSILDIIDENTILDNFFKAVDFVTLSYLHLEDGKNLCLQIARFTGLLTPLTAIGVTLYAATSRLRLKNKLTVWLRKSENLIIVLGENPEANDLAKDLVTRSFKVLQLKTNQQRDTVVKINNNHLIESIYSNIDEQVFDNKISKAKMVYLMQDDKTNLEEALRFESFAKGKKLSHLNQMLVHLRSDEKAKLLHNISMNLAEKLNLFNIQKNTIRRLLNYFPVDQDDININKYAIHVIEFNSLSQVLIEHLLAQLHMEKDKCIELNVYSENPQASEIEFFKLFSAFKRKTKSSSIEYYNWGNWKIKFDLYSKEISSHQQVLKNIEYDLLDQKSVSLYVCIENNSVSSTWLSAYLPRLNQLKQDTLRHLQVFSYHNSPNLQEEIQIERYYNKLAPNLFVTCFGNYLQECSFESINLDTLDELAIKIADWYDQKYNPDLSQTKNNWISNSYMDKKSNRHAADHIWIKWRWLLRNINNDTLDCMSSFNIFNTIDKTHLKEIGEIEHRRWCANLTLEGYAVLPEKYQSKWKENKTKFKSQNLHRDLIPFEILEQEDQEKDEDQIRGIPHFIKTTYQ